MHRVQAAELPDAEVEEELARQGRVQEVLPLVRLAHAAPGDTLMARQTRAQRRARRQAQEQSGAQTNQGGVAQRARTRQQQVRPSQQPAKSQAGSARRERGARAFVGESYAELKKVEWPRQPQVIQATVVVLIACLVVGVYLYAWDRIWQPVVQWLIGQ
jgi:preprotein translocase subunit SecE